MGCGSPLRAFQVRPGAPVSFSPPPGHARVLELPCGRCQGCRLERSRQDAVRCVHEASLHESNSFVTLTYDDQHLPPGGTLVKRDWQLFMKRLRRRFSIYDVSLGHWLPRFFMCGEYGELNGRPHYHACLFGVDFPDKVLLKEERGERLYRSALLDSCWKLGHASCGSVTFQSAAYVARYIMAKALGVSAGEKSETLPEFALRSLKPGLGQHWLRKFCSDVFPSGKVVFNGVECTAPRYYDKLFAREDPEAFEGLRSRRLMEADKRFDDNGPARLRVKEQVLKARISSLKRSL